MRRVSRIVVLVAAAALVVAAVARAASRHFLFAGRGPRNAVAPPDFVLREPVSRDGVVGRALELVAPAAAKTIVYFHNNRDTIEARLDVARALHARGYGVLLVEYRGYGGASAAEPTEDGLYLDAEAALDDLARRGVEADRVVLWGTSLGTGVAAEMARRGRGGRLVLETPYTSIPDLVTGAVPFVPARALVADRFETIAKAPEIHVPTLVIQGDADEIVPFAMGARVAAAIDGARLLRVAGGHHGDLFARDRDRLLAAIAPL